MGELFLVTAEKMSVLLAFFLIGFVLAKKKLIPADSSKTLSLLLTTVFNPALTLSSFITNLNRKSFAENAGLIGVGCIAALAAILAARLLSRSLAGKDEDLRALLDYQLAYSNYGYIGYPLILGIFGSAALYRFMLYAIPIGIGNSTYGRMRLEGRKRLSLGFLLLPQTMALFLGLLIGLLEIPIPRFVNDFLSSAGSCMGPVGMLVVGMSLSRVDLGKSLKDGRNYLYTALRLVLLPLACALVCKVLGVGGEAMFFSCCVLCFCFGSNPFLYREAIGKDASGAAGMTLLSYVFSLVTVPLMFALFWNMSGL